MIILLTNDDGYGSEGLQALERVFAADPSHEVWVIAPETERSGQSHSITLKDPIRSRTMGERRHALSGTPADCVLTAVLGIMPRKPDIVISGINHGPNLGTDITYSGTAAAARQAAYMGICGIAVSVNAFGPPWHFGPLARFVHAKAPEFLRLFDGHHFVNVNGPNDDNHDADVEVTHPCFRSYNDHMVKFESPRGEDYWFLKGSPIDTSDQEGSDWNAVARGCISISPVHLHPLNNLVDREYLLADFTIARPGGNGQ